MGAIDAHPGDSVHGASASNVYVSVREPNGLPVTESATVKLSFGRRKYEWPHKGHRTGPIFKHPRRKLRGGSERARLQSRA
jgi:hypothetical protein